MKKFSLLLKRTVKCREKKMENFRIREFVSTKMPQLKWSISKEILNAIKLSDMNEV